MLKGSGGTLTLNNVVERQHSLSLHIINGKKDDFDLTFGLKRC